ncbi:MAG: leucine-rich repeat domain-containing protein, partial [Lachnospiraceae bacterium]|nr:leucine-rich repeat domain-containing protein [Lachnospiraceae bacterium]
MMKRILSLILVISLVFSGPQSFVVTAMADEMSPGSTSITSGDCGDNLTWELQDNNSTLVISGTGDMWDYGNHWDDNKCGNVTSAPWGVFWETIDSISLPEELMSIGEFAFNGLNISTISIPEFVTNIGDWAFEGCRNLSGVLVIPISVAYIGQYAFADTGISSVIMPEPWPELDLGPFRECRNLTEVYAPKSGTCGDALTWELQEDGTLVISGSGTMWTYGNMEITEGKIVSGAPWGDHWESIERISLQEGSTSICQCAFQGLNITEVTIPGTVIDIESYAFADCTNLTGVLDIPDSVSTIGSYAFANTGISEVNMPESWPLLGEGAFSGCWNYTPKSGVCGDDLTWELQENGTLVISGTGEMWSYDITWYDSAEKYITNAPWANSMESINSIIFSEGLTSIGHYAFFNLNNISSISIPNTVTHIGVCSFNGCENLSGQLVIPDSVTYIGDNAFAATGYSTVILPDSWPELGQGVFSGPNLTKVYAPKNGTCGENLAWELHDDGTLVISGTGEMSPYSSNWNNAAQKQITSAPWGYHWDSIESITLSEGLTSIGRYAFFGLNITEIIIPASVTGIGDYAFAYTEISSVDMPEPWPQLGVGVFRYCPNLQEVYAPKSGTCGDNLAWELQDDGTLVISGSGAMWSYGLWYDDTAKRNFSDAPWGEHWKSIERVSISEGVTSIGAIAFWGLNITEITIPESVTSIGDYAFAYTEIRSVDMPEPWPQLGVGVFLGCWNLEEVFAPKSGTCGDNLTWELQEGGTLIISGTGDMWGYSVNEFWVDGTQKLITAAPWGEYWKSIEYIILPEGLTSIGNFAFLSLNITEITIPNTVTYIGWSAFEDTNLAGTLVIPESVTKIGDFAFAKTGITGTLVIPESVTEIGNYAFTGTEISSVIMPDPWPQLGDEVFYNCRNLTETPAPRNGNCGDNLTWELQDDGTLVVSGVGEMWSYGSSWDDSAQKQITSAPWGYHWKSIEQIVLPEGLTFISDSAFCGLNITEITIPNTVTRIGFSAFEGCENLSGVLVIPESVTQIGDYAFANTGISGVSMPEPEPQLGVGVFLGCWNLQGSSEPKSGTCGNKLTWELQDNGTLVISGMGDMHSYEPGFDEIEMKMITTAPWGAHWKSIERVILPEGLTTIGGWAFCGLNITEIIIPDTVIHIGNGAFCSTQLNGILEIPESVTYIADDAFAETGINKVYMPENWPEIGFWTFPNDVVYVTLKSAVITADAILYAEPSRNEKQNGIIAEGTEVVVAEREGDFIKLSDGNWIESKYVYEFSTPYPATADKLGQGTTVAKISYYEYPS